MKHLKNYPVNESLDVEKIAEEIYDEFTNSEYGEKIWDEAREKYPEYNHSGEDTDLATDYITNEIESIYKSSLGNSEAYKPFDKFTDGEWHELEEELRDKIMAGLT